MVVKNKKPFSLYGRLKYRLLSIIHLFWATFSVVFKRAFRGPKVEEWSLQFEISNTFLTLQNQYAFDLDNIDEAREFMDSLVFYSPSLEKVDTESISSPVSGIWFYPENSKKDRVILYFHGGGYVYFPRSYLDFIANISQLTNTTIFAIDYPLIPEYRYPNQLECALNSYEFLLKNGYSSEQISVMGDSAGGNLCLSLLLKMRDEELPLPSSAVAISPWTNVQNPGESMIFNEKFDWVESRMAYKWAAMYAGNQSRENPYISPFFGNLSGLPPIYIQAGGKEILIDMIKEFYKKGRSQNIDIKLDVWEKMTHDFQAYGEHLEESKEAIIKIRRFLASDIYTFQNDSV